MTAQLEFFYDYVSVYSYLANSQLGRLGTGHIRYRPMFLGGVMQATDNRPPATVQKKGEYLRHDVERWVDRYQLPFSWNPVFPQNTLKALRLALVAERDGTFDAVHQRMFDAIWTERADLADTDILTRILRSADLPVDQYMTAIEQVDIKFALKSISEEAVSRGAFGAPTFFVRERMFFGNDRLEWVAEALREF
jgi:2-hydroxychromene-2-carboxylate isomerase